MCRRDKPSQVIHELNYDDQWTTEYLVDELNYELLKKEYFDTNTGHLKRKYEQLAKELIYRIPVQSPCLPFIIHLNDLSSRVQYELANLEDTTMDYVIRTAIGRIFEAIDKRYFLINVRHLLHWELRE
jgi:hypothetical protein